MLGQYCPLSRRSHTRTDLSLLMLITPSSPVLQVQTHSSPWHPDVTTYQEWWSPRWPHQCSPQSCAPTRAWGCPCCCPWLINSWKLKTTFQVGVYFLSNYSFSKFSQLQLLEDFSCFGGCQLTRKWLFKITKPLHTKLIEITCTIIWSKMIFALTGALK